MASDDDVDRWLIQHGESLESALFTGALTAEEFFKEIEAIPAGSEARLARYRVAVVGVFAILAVAAIAAAATMSMFRKAEDTRITAQAFECQRLQNEGSENAVACFEALLASNPELDELRGVFTELETANSLDD